MTGTVIQKYLQYSKRIALFGIIQWAVLALCALILLSDTSGVAVDEYAVRVINNVVTCSSALAVAICSGYYAHSAYDNNLKQRVAAAFEQDEAASGNG